MSTKAEVIGAMWLYGQEYSQSRLSAADFYANLPPDRKRTVGEMVAQIGRAHANAALEAAAEEIRVFQDMVGWQKYDSRNQLVQDIEDKVLVLREPDATEEE